MHKKVGIPEFVFSMHFVGQLSHLFGYMVLEVCLGGC